MSITRCAFSVAVILAIAAAAVRSPTRLRRALAVVAHPGGAVGQQCGAVDQRRHLAELGLRELEVRQRLAEHLALLACATASASARRAMPSAAAATDARKMSSVRMASLKPPLQLAQLRVARHCAAVEAQRGQRMRRHHVDVLRGVQARASSASTMKAVMPRVPPVGSVLANTQ